MGNESNISEQEIKVFKDKLKREKEMEKDIDNLKGKVSKLECKNFRDNFTIFLALSFFMALKLSL